MGMAKGTNLAMMGVGTSGGVQAIGLEALKNMVFFGITLEAWVYILGVVSMLVIVFLNIFRIAQTAVDITKNVKELYYKFKYKNKDTLYAEE